MFIAFVHIFGSGISPDHKACDASQINDKVKIQKALTHTSEKHHLLRPSSLVTNIKFNLRGTYLHTCDQCVQTVSDIACSPEIGSLKTVLGLPELLAKIEHTFDYPILL